MEIVKLRTLTKKSKLGFGKYRNETIGTLLGMKQYLLLTGIYFKLSKINFIPEILAELNIVGEWLIEKPSTDKVKYYQFLDAHNFEKRDRSVTGSDHLKKARKRLSNSSLQSINHGRKYK